MIPQFPKFKALEIEDKKEVDALTKLYRPYSDFNFLSMWSWDIEGQTLISQFNHNLIVRFSDYITKDLFYSFLGSTQANEMTGLLFEMMRNQGLSQYLKLLPFDSKGLIDEDLFFVSEDLDNFDYVFSLERLAKLIGSKLAPKRNYVKRFLGQNDPTINQLDFNNKSTVKEIESVFESWVKWKNFSREEAENESQAMLRFIRVGRYPNNINLGFRVKGKLIGFWFFEILQDGYVMSHFEKALASDFIGIYPFMMREGSKYLFERGLKYLNYEQDLGIKGLREAKKDYLPIDFLKKFIVRRKDL